MSRIFFFCPGCSGPYACQLPCLAAALDSFILFGVNAGIIPQQRKLMGSSAQISSGVCRCGSEEQVPEEGSGRFRRVPVCVGVGSGGRFRKVLEGSGACWCRFRRQLPEGPGGFQCVLVLV